MNPNPSTNATEVSPPARPRRVMRRVEVTRVTRITPHTVRVTFTGDNLAEFGWNGAAAHIKLIFPEDGQTEPAFPGPDGPRPTRIRTYTPRRFDATVPELDVEFVLHGDGPASQWAEQAQVGQVLVLAGPGPNYQIDPAADWFLLAGDDSALPAIATILELLPASVKAYVLVEVTSSQEEQNLASAAQLNINWLYRSGPADSVLEKALQAFELPAGSGRIYVGCEAGAMRRVRHHLIHDRQLDPATFVTRGYWKEGDTDYTDHDYGADVTS